MSHLVFILILAFVAWRWGNSLRPKKDSRPDVDRSASPPAAFTDDDQVEDAAADVAGLVSNLFGAKGQDFIEQAVNRAIEDARIRTVAALGSAEAMEPVVRAISSTRTASPPRDKQRAKYLLDGDNGFRQRTDRTARLQQSFRGKGLCSPR